MGKHFHAVLIRRARQRFPTRQKRSLAAVYREVAQACKAKKLPVPARNAVALCIASPDPRKVASSRGGQDAARDMHDAGGVPPEVTAPLEQVQIGHTVIDLIIVDERDRQPVGRPYLTVAIDVFTRCVPGMAVTLEAPSAVSVGLCLAQAVCDKRPSLERIAHALPIGAPPAPSQALQKTNRVRPRRRLFLVEQNVALQRRALFHFKMGKVEQAAVEHMRGLDVTHRGGHALDP